MQQDHIIKNMSMDDAKTPVVHILNFDNPELCIRTTPVSCKIRGVKIPIIGKQNWISLLVSITNMFIEENNPKINDLKQKRLASRFSRPFILEHKVNDRNHARLINGCWIYVDLGIPMLVKIIRALCTYCGLNLSDIEIKYIAKSDAVFKDEHISVHSLAKNREQNLNTNVAIRFTTLSWNEQIASGFRFWMETKGMSGVTARSYSSAVGVIIQKYPLVFKDAQKMKIASEGIRMFISSLKNIKEYILMNEKSHYQHKAALKKFCAYIDDITEYPDVSEKNTSHNSIETESQVLDIIKEKFPEGLRLGFVDISKLHSFYAEEYKNELTIEESFLYEVIRKNTVCIDGATERYSCMHNLVESKTLTEIENFIDSQFAGGRQRVYIGPIFNIFRNKLSVIVNENTLMLIIETIFNHKYKINRMSNFVFSRNKELVQQMNDEICDAMIQLLEQDIVPFTIDELNESFPGYPHNKILGILNGNLIAENGGLIVSLGGSAYAHVEYVYLSENDLSEIVNFISRCIESIGYKTTNELFDDIKVQIPDVINNNEGIDKLGIMKAIKYHTEKLFAVAKQGQGKTPSFDVFIALPEEAN